MLTRCAVTRHPDLRACREGVGSSGLDPLGEAGFTFDSLHGIGSPVSISRNFAESLKREFAAKVLQRPSPAGAPGSVRELLAASELARATEAT